MKHCSLFCRPLLLLLPVLAAGCVGTSAPTDTATVTTGNIADVSSGYTSSSSPGSDSVDNLAQAEYFILKNYVLVKIDIARGRGEYLNSLAALLMVPETDRQKFFNRARMEYKTIYHQGKPAPEYIITRLSRAAAFSDDRQGGS